ncbi:PREDICTED: uncharacterized protein LOC109356831 isoform X2 [Lupinus angustifolius]|uniref:uncharacterized protein LOC109356831 isoform X2 n=1 Tax=Lupinus angustifolius TaxID=3871 RepID=UPI00092FBCD2|nr:PREDICTED: uncharacterized protein LOC109356831 isoform X2 [Lupinus angustifolius]
MSRGDRMTSDLNRTGTVERDIEQAITALKKGAYLLKYGRRGKPKFCPFRLSNDESVLIWFSGKEEKHLKLSHVSRIISGQRTPIFQRYPRPEKEYQSFSLIYNDRSLDMICKDKDEAEVWFSGLKALISRSHHRKWRTDSRSDGVPSEANSPRTYTRRSSPLNSPFDSNESLQKDSGDHLRLHSPYESPPKNGLDKAFSDVVLYAVPPKVFFPPESASGSVHSVSSGGSDSTYGHMKSMGMDAFRVSLSSAVSSSSQGSGHDDGDALGDVFIWGEGTGDGVLGGGTHRVGSCLGAKMDSLFPKALESAVVLDVQNIACGGQHAALVTKQGEIFSWGEESGGRLGHGVDSDVLHPKLIESLCNTNIELVACGEYHTCALPTCVEGKLSKSFMEEIACGAYHVAALTSRTEVYTWGKGANGRLGHGDTDDKNVPTLVEALKDKQVKSIACGTNFTAAICLHKWVSGVDQSMCSGCRLPFNFKRKRHNCYNCGLVFCHSCSSKKCLKASMAPNPNKPYRVCDNCFNKLRKAIESDPSSHSAVSRRGSINQGSLELIDKDDKLDSKSRNQLARFSSMESFQQVESKSSKKNKKLEFNSSRVSPVPNAGSQWGALNISKSLNPVFGSSKKFFSASVPGSRIVSRATSPISRRPSPPRSTTPTPTLGGLTSPKIVVDDAKKTNDSLSQEVIKLRSQVENLTRKAQLQEIELERTTKQLKDAIAIAGEETAKCKAAKEVIKSLTSQLKDMAERLPLGAARNIKSPSSLASFGSSLGSNEVSYASMERLNIQATSPEADLTGLNNQPLSNGSSTISNRSVGHNKQSQSDATNRNGSRMKDSDSRNETEWVEQDESGVYITLTSLPGGVIELKRVRFSRKRFSEKQAEQWWAENRARVYEQYNVRMIDKSTVGVGSEDLAH